MEAGQRVSESYTFGPYRLCAHERVLRYKGEPVILASKAVELLFVLLSDGDRIISKADLMDRIWPDADVDEANLTQTVYLLRKLFLRHQSGVRIDNIPKQGYRIVLSGAPRSQARGLSRYLAVAACVLVFLTIAVASAVRFNMHRAGHALDGDALREYMLARDYQEKGWPKNLQRSVVLFTSVMRAKPDSALPYAGLAVSDASLAYYASDENQRAQLQASALTLARRAVAIDPSSADAYAALGGAEYSIDHDKDAASVNLQRALKINPNQLNALVWYGSLLLDEGNVSQARRLLNRAVGIAPNSSGTIATLAWSDFIAADYLGAIELSNQDIVAQGQPTFARITLANAYLMSGNYTRAASFARMLLRDPETRIQGRALLARLAVATEHGALAAALLRSLVATTDPRTIGSWDAASIASAYVALGDRARAFVWLARVRPWERGQVLHDPRFSALTRDRAFAAWVNG